MARKSSNIYCKGCGNNNHGWCPVKQTQVCNLVGITICDYKTPEGVKSDLSGIDLEAEKVTVERANTYKAPQVKKTAPSDDNVFVSSTSKRGDSEGYVVMGKRAMFYNMQRQIIAIESEQNEISIRELKQLMVGLEKGLLIDEKCHGIEYDSEIDADIIKDSKMISNHWYQTVGELPERPKTSKEG